MSHEIDDICRSFRKALLTAPGWRSGENPVANIFGDVSGTLGDQQIGASQFLTGTSVSGYALNYIYGDAFAMNGAAHGGDDVIFGVYATINNETIFGDAGVMSDFSVGGNDQIIGAGETAWTNAVIYGDANRMTRFAHGGDDMIIGSAATVFGDAQTMSEFAVGGNDYILGGAYRHDIWGDAQQLSGFAQGGDDVILGRSGYGGYSVYGDGSLSGNARGGNDIITIQDNSYLIVYGDGPLSGFAHGGDDVIVGGTNASNQIWGDGPATGRFTAGGSDTFVFDEGTKTNRIMDFEHGKDKIDLTGFSNVHDFGHLNITHGDLSGYGDSTANSINLGNGAIIVVAHTELQASDFIFA